jgi:hypothetical protein
VESQLASRLGQYRRVRQRNLRRRAGVAGRDGLGGVADSKEKGAGPAVGDGRRGMRRSTRPFSRCTPPVGCPRRRVYRREDRLARRAAQSGQGPLPSGSSAMTADGRPACTATADQATQPRSRRMVWRTLIRELHELAHGVQPALGGKDSYMRRRGRGGGGVSKSGTKALALGASHPTDAAGCHPLSKGGLAWQRRDRGSRSGWCEAAWSKRKRRNTEEVLTARRTMGWSCEE